MKKFSLEEYLAHPEKKVVTKEGLPVRILCTDRMDAHSDYVKKPIVALVLLKDKIQEQVVNYTKDGHLLTPGQEDDLDLFFADEEPELSEFEEKVKQLIGSYPCANKENNGALLYEVRKAAAELLELARKELTIQLRKHFEERNAGDTTLEDLLSYKEGFDIGKSEGKAEALKGVKSTKQ